MVEEITAPKKSVAREPRSITSLSVSGFKSISNEQSIEIKPFTILAGANSSGKSSMMQPLLMLKQTLEATYNPGPLKIDGPNVKFDAFDQFLSHVNKNMATNPLVITLKSTIGAKSDLSLALKFDRAHTKTALETVQMTYTGNKTNQSITLHPDMSEDAIKNVISNDVRLDSEQSKLVIGVDRCFLTPARIYQDTHRIRLFVPFEVEVFTQKILDLIHVTGIRGNPERNYPVAAVGPTFPGTFEVYTGSVIWEWQQNKPAKIQSLQEDLASLQLGTSEIQARKIGDIQIEVLVSRLPHQSSGPNGSKNGSKNTKRDMVSLADVGLGVSHTLSVLVALQVAQPGQMVYIEQPEIHLHPKAQVAMAQILANAAKRGVRVVVETHSDLLLIGIETLVAEGKLSPDLVKLHWFERDKRGVTKITSGDLDKDGAFGEWPEDFGLIDFDIKQRYLDAVASRQAESRNGNSRPNNKSSH